MLRAKSPAPDDHEASATAPQGRTGLWAGIALVTLVMIAAFSSYVFSLLGTVDRQSRELRTLQDSVRALSVHQGSNAIKIGEPRSVLAIVHAPRAALLPLRPRDGRPGARGTLVVDRGSGDVALIVSGLFSGGNERAVLRVYGARGSEVVGVVQPPDTAQHAYVFKIADTELRGCSVTSEDGVTVFLEAESIH